MIEYRTITKDDITPELCLLIADVVESWFATDPLNREDFADRLEARLPEGLCLPDQFDDPVMTVILKMARKIKRELD